ncbi:hypothetical protein [Actinokineospora globicatena]|uniref:Uncharacterized protein n=1 Tax=Actinokineospora globicatena TaxID=103729 RepID=A0A9W6QPG5_9PSEU|nr:hypothetical protein [Actinokineospora globicatena]GLW92229.1 hypothetical protein Aglo03_30450 [Actinokineospora globicatena]
MGKARRNKRNGRSRVAERRASTPTKSEAQNGHDAADAALARLCRFGSTRHSLAEAYALGYATLMIHQVEGTTPDWMHESNPLDLIVLGMTFGKNFRNGYEFANTRTAWLRHLRDTKHWRDIERFVSVAMELSQDTDLALDSGKLLYALASRLEDADLDKNRLPKSLNPEELLADARFAYGPPRDFALPEPSAESIAQAEAYLADLSSGIDLPDSYATALRDALWLFDRAGLPLEADPSLLLIALYTGVAASSVNDLGDLAEPALAWAASFDHSSPLSKVLDTILVASSTDLTTVDTLARLLTIPAFLEPVETNSRSWNRLPGSEMADIAISLGYARAEFVDHKTIALSPITAAQLRRVRDSFEEDHGRPLAPDDQIFKGVDHEDLKRRTIGVLRSIGVHPAVVSAFEAEDLLPTSLDSFHTSQERKDWLEAVSRHVSTNPGTATPDLDAEFLLIKTLSISILINSLADDPKLAREVITLIDGASAYANDESADLIDFLESQESYLSDLVMAAERKAQVIEKARSWGGEGLVRRVVECVDEIPAIGVLTDPVVLLVAAAVWIGSTGGDEH